MNPVKSGSATSAAMLKACRVMPAVLGFFALTALAAQVRVPVPGTTVPMTLQLLAVLLCGFTLPPWAACSAMLAYLLAGCAGLPVFTPGSSGVFGETGGYLIGFSIAAFLVSRLSGRGSASTVRLALSGAAGMMVVFLVGVPWRLAWVGGDVQLAVLTGLAPFALKGVVEVCLAVVLAKRIRHWQGKG